jgi:predicted RNase H-like HicB family nuclease
MEVIFEVREAEEGGYTARALGYSIFTEAETWEELRNNVREVTTLHFEDEAVRPKMVQLHFIKDELVPLEAA